MEKMFHTKKEILELFKARGLPSNFCLVPFTNLIFNPGGQISVCRFKGTDHSIGHLSKNTLEEIWNNEYMQTWRNEFLTGNVKICAREQMHDACHLSASNYHFFDEVKVSVTQELKVQKLTANLNGLCNLKCKMCKVWRLENAYYDKINFWEDAETKFFPFVKEIELLSGEPFIQKDTYRLIDLVSRINPDCVWSFTTNAHWKLTDQVKSSLDKINVKTIIVSIDSLISSTFSEIRQGGGNLEKLLKTLDDLQDYSLKRLADKKTDLGLTIHFLIMPENFKELPEFVEFCAEKKIRHKFKLLVEPLDQSALVLDTNKKIELLDAVLERLNSVTLAATIPAIFPVVQSLPQIERANYLDTIKSILQVSS